MWTPFDRRTGNSSKRAERDILSTGASPATHQNENRSVILKLFGHAAFALIIAAIFESLALRGVLSASLAQASLVFAWLVSTIWISSSDFISNQKKSSYRASMRSGAAIFLAIIFFVMDRGFSILGGSSALSPPTAKEIADEVFKEQPTPLSVSQAAALNEIYGWIGSQNENSLQSIFDFKEILNKNIDLITTNRGPWVGQTKISTPVVVYYGKARFGFNKYGQGVGQFDRSEITIIATTNRYMTSMNRLTGYCDAALLPYDVRVAIRGLYLAVSGNLTFMRYILQRALNDDPDRIFKARSKKSPYFLGLQNIYFARMRPLLPEVEKLNRAIRNHLDSKASAYGLSPMSAVCENRNSGPNIFPAVGQTFDIQPGAPAR